MKIMRRLLLFLVLAMVLVLAYSAFIEPNLLVARNHLLQFDKIHGEQIRVVQFTDTHLGDFFDIERLERVVEKINEQNADIVVFTGDLLDEASTYTGEMSEISEVLSRVQANYGKLAVRGNRDNGGGAEFIFPKLMEDAGFILLDNEQHRLEVNGTQINILGTDDKMLGNYDPVKTVEGIKADDFNLLLVHEPDLIKDFLDYPIDLALSGHSHGGQVYIPFFGSLITPPLAEIYMRGFYYMENSYETILYVNTGLGNTILPFRFFNIPNVAVFDLQAE